MTTKNPSYIQGIKSSQTARKVGPTIGQSKKISTIREKSIKKKDGLKEIIEEAAPVAIADQNQATTESNLQQVAFDLCVDTLMNGCVSSFVELYQLSHRAPVCVDPLSNQMFSLSLIQLPQVQNWLIQAEKSRRAGEFRQVYESYMKLASFFEDEKDVDTSLHFLQLALENAKQSSDKELEGNANETYGLVHERLNHIETAIQFHETTLRLAEASRNTHMKKKAHQNLIRVYMKRAAECEEEGNYHKAREMYEKSMNTARASSDSSAEGEAYHKLGNITVLLGDMEKALEYQKRFLLVSKEIRSDSHEGKAQTSLAQLQEQLGQVTDAISSLQRSLEIAEAQNNLEAICEACTSLGLLHNKQGNYLKAVHYLEQNFKVSKQIGDIARTEKARILVGVAQGNYIWSNGFVSMVDRDLDATVQWKSHGIVPGIT